MGSRTLFKSRLRNLDRKRGWSHYSVSEQVLEISESLVNTVYGQLLKIVGEIVVSTPDYLILRYHNGTGTSTTVAVTPTYVVLYKGFCAKWSYYLQDFDKAIEHIKQLLIEGDNVQPTT